MKALPLALPLALLMCACAAAWADDDAISPDRPDFTNGPDVMAAGRFQLETSGAWQRDQVDGVTTRLRSTPTLFRLGVGHALELRLETDGALRQSHPDASGRGDIALGAKWRMQEGDEGRPGMGRPFEVQTPEGLLHPLGTQFTVRRDDATRWKAAPATRLAVSEGAVQVHPFDAPADAGTVRVAAGRQVAFTRTAIGPVVALDEAAQAWLDGVLVAERMPLADFVAELGRYRSGRLRCASEVADLRITGTWPLEGPDPTDRILASVERQLPVRLQRLTRYWVTVQPR